MHTRNYRCNMSANKSYFWFVIRGIFHWRETTLSTLTALVILGSDTINKLFHSIKYTQSLVTSLLSLFMYLPRISFTWRSDSNCCSDTAQTPAHHSTSVQQDALVLQQLLIIAAALSPRLRTDTGPNIPAPQKPFSGMNLNTKINIG